MLKYLIYKEFLQLRRDSRMMGIILVVPVVQLLVFGYAASVDVKDLPTVICDYDKSPESRDYVARIFNNGYFERAGDLKNMAEIDTWLDRGKADIAIVVPDGFGRAERSGGSVTVQAIINGTDTTVGSVGLSYLAQINARYAAKVIVERFSKAGKGTVAMIDLKDRVWYNPELKSLYFMIPALISMIVMIITMMLTAMAIVKEKEIGTIEQLVVTPAKSYHIILAKLFPYTAICFLNILVILAIAVFWFGVPMKGSVPLLLGMALLFLLNTLGLGIFVSTLSRTQKQAMMAIIFFILLPFIYLSGFIFPIENMPPVVQAVTYAIPLRYFLTIIRGIFLKGVGLDVLWPDALCLLGIGTAILTLSIARFRKQI